MKTWQESLTVLKEGNARRDFSLLERLLTESRELVLDILPAPQLGAFSKEDGEAIIDQDGNRLK